MRWLSKLLNYVPAEERKGLSLKPPFWDVSCPRDFGAFLRALPDLVPEGCVLYLEGRPASEVSSYVAQRAAPTVATLAVGTIWPRPECLHMLMTRENCAGLAELAERHALPEIADHVHVYRNGEVLLQWYDAATNPIVISKQIPEQNVQEFCARLGIRIEEDTEAPTAE